MIAKVKFCFWCKEASFWKASSSLPLTLPRTRLVSQLEDELPKLLERFDLHFSCHGSVCVVLRLAKRVEKLAGLKPIDFAIIGWRRLGTDNSSPTAWLGRYDALRIKLEGTEYLFSHIRYRLGRWDRSLSG